MHKIEHTKWTALIKNKNSKDLWDSIDWNGNLSKCETVRPTDDELALHFEKLYSSDDPNESSKIEELSTDTYDPALDDPITNETSEITKKSPKNGSLNRDLLKFLNRYGIFWVPPGESSCPDGSEYVWQRGVESL